MSARCAALTVLLGLLLTPPGVAGQNGEERPDTAFVLETPVNPEAAPVPFGPGERLIYKVKVGIFGVGEGHMTVYPVDTVRGNPTYKAVMGIKGGLLGLNVDDEYSTWFDIRNLQSWRFIQDINDPGYTSYRHYEFYPERRTWEREDNDEFGTLGSAIPLDDIAFVYFIRTLPLEVGKSYTLNRYFKEEGNPVVVQVLRKDRRTTEAGEFNTIVVKPLIKTKGLFGQGGDAELHFTDDERRILVYMKSNLRGFPGSLTLHLKSIQEGLPLNPDSRAAALRAREARSQADTVGR